ncbi:hypothetical protein BH708_18680 [Brachybacterium sp. P6-10-X1]|uniref:hypothetical protein n=1 Tax=Brachybacterium sp. P6-10-X1 TaxID=1903186 RepID=UPI0009718EF2|nr:hypothetical protein [Brachybacterium sp. P6-10-X1]APX34396.1 hypothetical protein BH708_18680 [Brachybacterium sp. P6-10-X1]
MDDETGRASRPSTAATEVAVCAELPSALAPTPELLSGSRGLAGRATAGAAALGATALLVLSFGPAALALSPSSTAAPAPARVSASPAVSPTAAMSMPPRSEVGAEGEVGE